MKNEKDIGFLAAFESKKKALTPPPPPKPTSPEDAFVLQIVNGDLDGFTAQFDFPGAWGLELRNIRSPVSFILDGDFVGWDAPNLDARGAATSRSSTTSCPSTGSRWPGWRRSASGPTTSSSR
jgi:hypothetical protein